MPIRALLLLLLLQAQDPPRPVSLPDSFATPIHAFKIFMPARWQMRPGTGKAAMSFQPARGEGAVPRVDLYYQPSNNDFAKFGETFKESLSKAGSDFELLADEKFEKPGRTFRHFKTKFVDGGIAMKSMWMAVGAKGRVYLFGWTFTMAAFEQYARPIEAMMRSIHVYDIPVLTKETLESFLALTKDGNKFYSEGNFGEAAKKFREAAALIPDYPEAAAKLGQTYLHLKNYADAETAFQKAIKIDADDPSHYYNFGSVLLQEGKNEEAISALQKSSKADPTSEPTWTNLGVAYLRVNDATSAVTALEKAVTSDPESVAAHFNLGNAYEAAGKKEKAIAEFKETLKLDPKHEPAKDNLKRLEK